MGSLYRVTFHLDGRGVVYDPHEPPHLDGIISWAGEFRRPPRDTIPGRGDRIGTSDELPIPVSSQIVNGVRVYRASALWPDDEEFADLRHWRKRFRFERAAMCGDATINQSTGPFRLCNNGVRVLLIRRMVAWFHGNRCDVKKWFRAVRAIGRKREIGYGRVVSIDIVPTDEDRCLEWGGRAMRFLPHPHGLKRVRARPPYWNNTGRVKCLMVGDRVPT